MTFYNDFIEAQPVEENNLKLDGITVNLPMNTEPVFNLNSRPNYN